MLVYFEWGGVPTLLRLATLVEVLLSLQLLNLSLAFAVSSSDGFGESGCHLARVPKMCPLIAEQVKDAEVLTPLVLQLALGG